MPVADEVSFIIAKNLKIDPMRVKPATRLSDLSVDSLDLLEIVFMLEEKYDFHLDFEVKENTFEVKIDHSGRMKTIEFGTVGDIIETVQQLIDTRGQLANG